MDRKEILKRLLLIIFKQKSISNATPYLKCAYRKYRVTIKFIFFFQFTKERGCTKKKWYCHLVIICIFRRNLSMWPIFNSVETTYMEGRRGYAWIKIGLQKHLARTLISTSHITQIFEVIIALRCCVLFWGVFYINNTTTEYNEKCIFIHFDRQWL